MRPLEMEISFQTMFIWVSADVVSIVGDPFLAKGCSMVSTIG